MNWLDSLDFEHRSRDDIQVTLCQFYDQNQLAARLVPLLSGGGRQINTKVCET